MAQRSPEAAARSALPASITLADRAFTSYILIGQVILARWQAVWNERRSFLTGLPSVGQTVMEHTADSGLPRARGRPG